MSKIRHIYVEDCEEYCEDEYIEYSEYPVIPSDIYTIADTIKPPTKYYSRPTLNVDKARKPFKKSSKYVFCTQLNTKLKILK